MSGLNVMMKVCYKLLNATGCKNLEFHIPW